MTGDRLMAKTPSSRPWRSINNQINNKPIGRQNKKGSESPALKTEKNQKEKVVIRSFDNAHKVI